MFPIADKKEKIKLSSFLLPPDLALVKQNKKVGKSVRSDFEDVTRSYLLTQRRQGYSYIDVPFFVSGLLGTTCSTLSSSVACWRSWRSSCSRPRTSSVRNRHKVFIFKCTVGQDFSRTATKIPVI
jgi:hypothetical protein